MSVLFKICAIALVSVCASAILEHLRSGAAFGVKIAGGVAIFTVTVVFFGDGLMQTVDIFEKALGDRGMKYAEIMVKALGIAYVSGICTSLCRDIGESMAADGIETGGKLAIVSLAIPLISEMLGGAIGLLETV
jgi:stage III sporulation protein AD